jgi:homogentisate 1,2-dioxygenase
MVTWHPCGFTHGPHPKALKRMYEAPAKETQEYAVMLDARDGLQTGGGALATEFKPYADSWKTAEKQVAPKVPGRMAAE